MTSHHNQARQRRDVYYSGRVQGVGFRYTTRAIAGRFDVAGYVQNLPDGGVRLVVEGTPETLDRFLAELAEEMGVYIRTANCQTLAATGEFATFTIRH